MINKTFLAATLAAVLVAGSAFAGSFQAEVRFADPVKDRPNTTEYKAEFNDKLNNYLDYGFELTTKQASSQGEVKSTVVGKVGASLPAVFGVTVAARGELGHAIRQNDNFEFWGGEVKASRAVYGPVSADVGYRHRQGFAIADMKEDRLSGGLALALDNTNTVGAEYYRTRGTSVSDAVGVYYKRNF